MFIDPKNLSNQQKAILFGLFLSKYDKVKALKSLEYSTYNQAYSAIGSKLRVSPGSIQIHRNKFDTFFPNNRRGFQYNKEIGSLKLYEEWIQKTQELSFEEFLSILKSILESPNNNDDNDQTTRTFEKLSNSFEKAFERMLNGSDKFFRTRYPYSERNKDEIIEDDDFPYNDEQQYRFSESLLSSLEIIFEQNQEKHFSHYQIAATNLIDFINEHWDEDRLLIRRNRGLMRLYIGNPYYYPYYYPYSYLLHIKRKVRNMACNCLNMLCSFSIVDLYRDAFALFFVQGESYDFQRILVNRGCNALKGFFHHFPIGFFNHTLYDLDFVFHTKDKKRFIEFFNRVRSIRNIVNDRHPITLEKGSLYAELAYEIFNKKKSHSAKRTQTIKSKQVMIEGHWIDSKFKFPCKTMGFVAQTESNQIVLAFRGTKPSCIKNDITDLWQIMSGPDTAYLCALGLLLSIRRKCKTKQINVYGHSLGGGLSQFAVAAAIAHGDGNIFAYGYNSAGLSKGSIVVIKNTKASYDNIFHLFHESDIIWKYGSQLGRCYIIGHNKQDKWIHCHGIDTLISELNLISYMDLN